MFLYGMNVSINNLATSSSLRLLVNLGAVTIEFALLVMLKTNLLEVETYLTVISNSNFCTFISGFNILHNLLRELDTF